MGEIQLFNFHGHEVRIADREGNPWWVLADLCEVLGYTNVSKTASRVREKYKANLSLGSGSPAIIVNEAGLNQLLMRSNKPEAETFQDWIYEDVLPTLRKTGSYDIEQSEHPMVAQAKANLQLTERFVAVEHELAEAREARARIEAKADMALDEAHRMTIEEFVVHNGLLRQFPEHTWKMGATWLKRFCQAHGLPTYKTPVPAKSWQEEQAYPLQALAAWQRHAMRTRQQATLAIIPHKEMS